MRRHGASAAGSIVEHRIEHHLHGDRHFAAITGCDGQGRDMAPAGTLSEQPYPLSIDAQLRGVRMQPAQRRVIVLE